MKIKEYKCGCGHDEFFFADKGNQKGIYCSYCGKWLKWADKNEQNLAMKQEPQGSSEKPKMGKWVKTIGENGVTSAIRCSGCGFEDNRYELFNYCPNCGAKMSEIPTGQIAANGELYPGEFDDPLAEEGSEKG